MKEEPHAFKHELQTDFNAYNCHKKIEKIFLTSIRMSNIIDYMNKDFLSKLKILENANKQLRAQIEQN